MRVTWTMANIYQQTVLIAQTVRTTNEIIDADKIKLIFWHFWSGALSYF
jgi:hypothetical protein